MYVMETTDVHTSVFDSKPKKVRDEKKYPDIIMDAYKNEEQQFVVPWQMSKNNERRVFAE